jgi:hypothetical protein
MRLRKLGLISALLAASFVATGASAAHLFEGSTLKVAYYFPKFGVLYNGSPPVEVTVAPGGTIVTDDLFPIPGQNHPFILTIHDDEINVVYKVDTGWVDRPFNGLTIWDAYNDVHPSIVGVEILANDSRPGWLLQPERVTFNSGSIFINWAGTEWLAGGQLSIRVLSAPAPEPSTWALMIIGFGSAGAMLRRRKAVVA